MRWGRKQAKTPDKGEKGRTAGTGEMGSLHWKTAHAVSVIGAFMCLLFLCASVGAERREVSYSTTDSQAAVAAFLSEHASFSDALGISEYFPMPAVSVGSFSSRGEEAYRAFLSETESPWTFKAYLKDAFRALLGLP